MNPASSAAEFDVAMRALSQRLAAECKLEMQEFDQMLQSAGGVSTTQWLIWETPVSDGFYRLVEIGRLDLSVEALLLQPRFESLFSLEERERARTRLTELGFVLPAEGTSKSSES